MLAQRGRVSLRVVLGVAVCALSPTLLLAQTDNDSSGPPTTQQNTATIRTANTDEITVTARKREESLQDVPISISVFNDKAMRDRNIGSAYDLSAFTPNFSFSPNLGRRLDVPNIRGQFGPLISSVEPNASFFVDGVYISSSIATTSLANVEQVNVLRGPQSTQFGRATFSGAVDYITRKPTNELEGEINAKFGADGTREIGGWTSGPVPLEGYFNEKLFYFAGASLQKWDGEWRNRLLPGQVDSAEQVLFANLGAQYWRNNVQLPGDPPCSANSLPPLFDPDGPPGCAPTHWRRHRSGRPRHEDRNAKTRISAYRLL